MTSFTVGSQHRKIASTYPRLSHICLDQSLLLKLTLIKNL